MKNRTELQDIAGNVIDPMIDKIVGSGDHKVSGTKEYNKLFGLLEKCSQALEAQGVDSYHLIVEEKKERKAHKRLTLVQRKALRKDSKKLSVKELAAKYDVSLPTAKKYLS